MEQISPILRKGDTLLAFWCPGCNEPHMIKIGPWRWNGDAVKPTLLPSVLVQSGHYAGPGFCWCDFNKEHPGDPAPFKCGQCHSFVTDGQIRFLSDCTHALKDKIVPLPPWPPPTPEEGA